jgi:ATP-binding cassette, subfamily B, bacterial
MLTKKLNAKIANILDFIHSLPMGYQTMIGTDGLGLSAGQKQRILIARAVYKDPDYILMDEATNALDAENESEIICNMNNFLRGRTAVIIAHRLSTIRNANNIIVLGNGSVVEQGTHEELVSRNGIYHTLVKNQLNI